MTKLQALAIADVMLSQPAVSAALCAVAPGALKVHMEHRTPTSTGLWPTTEHLSEADSCDALTIELRFGLALTLEAIAEKLREGR